MQKHSTTYLVRNSQDSEIPASENLQEMSPCESQVVVVPSDHSLGMAAHVQPLEQGQVRYLPS